jgi:hypothetical protein
MKEAINSLKRAKKLPVVNGNILFPKKFEPFPNRTLRVSDKAWEEFKSNKLRSGKSWNQYIISLNKK